MINDLGSHLEVEQAREKFVCQFEYPMPLQGIFINIHRTDSSAGIAPFSSGEDDESDETTHRDTLFSAGHLTTPRGLDLGKLVSS